jgi:hypothetical protein
VDLSGADGKVDSMQDFGASGAYSQALNTKEIVAHLHRVISTIGIGEMLVAKKNRPAPVGAGRLVLTVD